MNKTLLSLITSVVLVLPVGAQEAEPQPLPPLPEGTRPVRDFQRNIQDVRKDLRVDIQEKRQEFRTEGTQSREDFQKEVEARRKEAKQQVEAKRAEFQEKVKQIKDERRKQLAEKLNKSLSEFNGKRTTHYTEVLNKLSEVLDRISSRADKAEARGLDVATTVRTAITEARKAIDDARAAVTEQAGKVYTATITGEENLKNDFGAVRKALHDDLVKVMAKVKAASQAVHKAATTLAQIPRVNEEQATTTQAVESTQ